MNHDSTPNHGRVRPEDSNGSRPFKEQRYLTLHDLRLESTGDISFEYSRGDELDLNRDENGDVFVRHGDGEEVYEMNINRRQDLYRVFDSVVSEEELDEQIGFETLPLNDLLLSNIRTSDVMSHLSIPENFSRDSDADLSLVHRVPVRRRNRVQSYREKVSGLEHTSPSRRDPDATVVNIRQVSVRRPASGPGSVSEEEAPGYLIDAPSFVASPDADTIGDIQRQLIDLDEVSEVKRIGTGRLVITLTDSDEAKTRKEIEKSFLQEVSGFSQAFDLIQRTDGTFMIESVMLNQVEVTLVDGEDYLADNRVRVNYRVPSLGEEDDEEDDEDDDDEDEEDSDEDEDEDEDEGEEEDDSQEESHGTDFSILSKRDEEVTLDEIQAFLSEDEILSILDQDALQEASPEKVTKVIAGKKVMAWKCPEGFKKSGGGQGKKPKCVKMSAKERAALSKAAKRIARMNKGKRAQAAKKAAKSRKKRASLGL